MRPWKIWQWRHFNSTPAPMPGIPHEGEQSPDTLKPPAAPSAVTDSQRAYFAFLNAFIEWDNSRARRESAAMLDNVRLLAIAALRAAPGAKL